MEESLKARLIGAAVLVALAVLLIPELLSGRKPAETPAEGEPGARGTRTFTIELGAGAGQVARSPTAAPVPTTAPAPVPGTSAAPPRSEPAVEPDETEAAEPPTPEPRPAAVASTPAARPAPDGRSEPAATPVAEPPPPRVAAAGDWAVQVGAFGSVETARGLVKDLSGDGYRAFLSPVVRSGKTLHRVRVGPESDRAGAERLAQRLKARGLPATVVRND